MSLLGIHIEKPKIELVSYDEKFEKIKLVKPNIIFNRQDVRFNNQFELLKVYYNSKIFYIPFHIELNTAFLGLYMTEIDKNVFLSILKFIRKTFSITRFYLIHSLNTCAKVNNTVHGLIELPESFELFNKRFSKKTLYNRRREKRLLEEKYNCEYFYYKQEDITEELIQEFLDLKHINYKDAYENKTANEILTPLYNITEGYAIKIDGKLAAIFLLSIMDNEDVYAANTTFDPKYSKYGIGILSFYYTIENLINRGFKRIYLGDGKYDYKKNAKAIITNTYQGYFNYPTLKEKIFPITYKMDKGILYKYLNWFNKSFLIKQVKMDYVQYQKLYKKLKMQKHINKLSQIYKDRKLVIYGAGLMSQVLFENYDLSKLNIVAICDKKYENIKGEKFHSIRCISPDELDTIEYDNMLVNILRSSIICKKYLGSVPFIKIKL